MSSPLDHLERRLQSIIEASTRLFGRSNRQDELTRQLVAALYDQLPAQLYGKPVAPDQFTIYLHPENLVTWQQPQWVDWIGRMVDDALLNAGFSTSARPAIQLAPATELQLDELRLKAVHSGDVLGSTAAMPVTGELRAPMPQPEIIPVNAYLIVQGNQTVSIAQNVFNIGRRADNDLVLDDPRISRTHLQIRAIRGHYTVFDLNSTGGTLVNGNPVREHMLVAGDVITIGGISLIYGEDAPAWPDAPGNATSPVGT